MGKIRRLAGETALYGLGSILPRVINFALVRPHTDVFENPADYGVITNLYAYATFISVIFTFGMETAYFRFNSRPGSDEKRIFNLAQTTVLAISLTLSLIFLLFYQPIAARLSLGNHPEYIVWFVTIMFVDALVAIPFARLRYQKKALMFALGKVLNIAIVVIINLYFVYVVYGESKEGVDVGFVFLANLIANLFYVFFFAKVLLSWRPAYDKNISPQMFTYSFPVMITGLAGMTNETFSRLTLQLWLPENFYPGKSSDYALGVFGACYKFAMLMNLAVQSFRLAAEPFFFSNAQDKSSPVLFARVNHYFIVVCCVIFLGVSVNIDVLKHFLGDEKYWEGLGIVPVLLLGYLFMGLYFNMTTWFKLTDKTYFGTILAAGGAVITIVGNFILIPLAGYMGSSIVTLICYASMAIACYLLGQKYYPIPYQVGTALLYIIATTALVYITLSVPVSEGLISFAFHQGVVLAYLFVIYLVERKHFRSATQ